MLPLDCRLSVQGFTSFASSSCHPPKTRSLCKVFFSFLILVRVLWWWEGPRGATGTSWFTSSVSKCFPMQAGRALRSWWRVKSTSPYRLHSPQAVLCCCSTEEYLAITLKTLPWIHEGINFIASEAPIYPSTTVRNCWYFFSIAVAKQVPVCFSHVLDRLSTHFQTEVFRIRRLSIQAVLAGTLIREKNTLSIQLTETVLEPHWQLQSHLVQSYFHYTESLHSKIYVQFNPIIFLPHFCLTNCTC